MTTGPSYPASALSACWTAWPVPFCSASTASATSRPAIAASAWWRSLPTTTTRLSAPSASTRSSRCKSSGRLAIGCSTLWVSERMRVPCPAARITTANRRCSLIARSNGMALSPMPVSQKRKRRPPKGPPQSPGSRGFLENGRIIFVPDEAHLLDVSLLGHGQDLVDDLVTRGRVRLQVQLGNRVHLLRGIEIGAKLLHRDRRAVPQDLVLRVDRQDVLDRLHRTPARGRLCAVRE